MKNIINELNARGIEARFITVTKNGIEREGLQIGNKDVAPVIYDYDSWDIDDLVNLYEQAPKINVNNITSADYIKDNVIICLQQKSNEDIVKGTFLDMEYYFRVSITDGENSGSYKLTEQNLAAIGMSSGELLTYAYSNLLDKTNIQSLNGILFGDDSDEPPYCVQTKDKVYGAGAIIMPYFVRDFCKQHGYERVIILPSSIHELLIVPDTFGTIEEMSAMVSSINATEVLPEEVLSDHAYLYDYNTNEFTW